MIIIDDLDGVKKDSSKESVYFDKILKTRISKSKFKIHICSGRIHENAAHKILK